jgi:hypothetical protein
MNDLTEKWKKGKFEEGYYFIKNSKGIFIDRLDKYQEWLCDYNVYPKFEVLSEVPTYKEYQALKEKLNNITKLKETYEKDYLHSDKERLEKHQACENFKTSIPAALKLEKELKGENKKLKHEVYTMGLTIGENIQTIEDMGLELAKYKEALELIVEYPMLIAPSKVTCSEVIQIARQALSQEKLV